MTGTCHMATNCLRISLLYLTTAQQETKRTALCHRICGSAAEHGVLECPSWLFLDLSKFYSEYCLLQILWALVLWSQRARKPSWVTYWVQSRQLLRLLNEGAVVVYLDQASWPFHSPWAKCKSGFQNPSGIASGSLSSKYIQHADEVAITTREHRD